MWVLLMGITQAGATKKDRSTIHVCVLSPTAGHRYYVLCRFLDPGIRRNITIPSTQVPTTHHGTPFPSIQTGGCKLPRGPAGSEGLSLPCRRMPHLVAVIASPHRIPFTWSGMPNCILRKSDSNRGPLPCLTFSSLLQALSHQSTT